METIKTSAVPIITNVIPYLEREILDQYADIQMISTGFLNGKTLKTKIHSLALLTFTRFFRENIAAKEDDEIVIITEFSPEDMLIFANFVMEGIIPPKGGIPSVKNLFRSFGIDINNITRTTSPLLFNNFEIKKEEENMEINHDENKDDIVLNGFIYPEDFDSPPEVFSDEEYVPDYLRKRGSPKKSNFKRMKRRKNEIKYLNLKNDDDGDWDPATTSDIILKNKIKVENTNEDHEDYFANNSKQNFKLNLQEKNVYKEYMNLAKKYGHIIRVHPPESHGPDLQDIQNYKLSEDLDSYIQTSISHNNSTKQKKYRMRNAKNYKKPIQCPKCPIRFANKIKLESHDLLEHNSHYQCPLCQKPYSLSMVEEFKIHMYRHEKMNVKAHECINCGFSSYVSKIMIKHINQQGPFHTNGCSHCPKKFQSHQDFKNHMESSHPDLPTWRCSTCGELFFSLTDIDVHQLEHDSTKSTKSGTICEFCGKTFLGSLSQHINRAHSNHKIPSMNNIDQQVLNFPCNQCQQRFKSEKCLQSHINRSHTKYACDQCGKMVMQKHRVRHMQSFHTDPEHRTNKCPHCGKGFSTGQILRDHINIHTGERPYVCKICGKTFASSGNRQMHLRTTHLGYKRTKK